MKTEFELQCRNGMKFTIDLGTGKGSLLRQFSEQDLVFDVAMIDYFDSLRHSIIELRRADIISKNQAYVMRLEMKFRILNQIHKHYETK